MYDYTRLTVTLKIAEREALHALALQELRDTGSQAALIIRQELERRGLIQSNQATGGIKELEASNVGSSHS